MYKLLFLLLIPAHALAQPPAASAFTVKSAVNITEPVEKIYFYYNDGEKNTIDSVDVVNGGFQFRGNIPEPGLATIRLKMVKQPGEEKQKYVTISFFLEAGESRFVAGDSAGLYKMEGGQAQMDYIKLKKMLAPFEDKLVPLSADYAVARKNKNKEEMQRLEAIFEKADSEIKEQVYEKFISEKRRSPVALYAVKQYAGWDLDPAKVEPLFASLPESTRNYPSAIKFKESIETAKKTAVGAMAMDFTQNDTLGRAVSLSSFRGKYVLVDFWASWCGPCRVENPNIVKVFNQYKDKGFTVLGVSLDRDNGKEKWLKAIHDDNLTWTHVSDLKYWDNEVAKQYGIRAIPQNILVDPSGKIVARNLTGKKLEDKLAELIR